MIDRVSWQCPDIRQVLHYLALLNHMPVRSAKLGTEIKQILSVNPCGSSFFIPSGCCKQVNLTWTCNLSTATFHFNVLPCGRVKPNNGVLCPIKHHTSSIVSTHSRLISGKYEY